jgi:hypothetical protein
MELILQLPNFTIEKKATLMMVLSLNKVFIATILIYSLNHKVLILQKIDSQKKIFFILYFLTNLRFFLIILK